MSFYSEASLAYVASAGAGKDGKAYSMKPVDGTGDFTFSRGSNLAATRVGANGLIEKGRENLLLQSNNFDTGWSNSATLTSGESGYDGSSDAWLLTKAASGDRARQVVSSSGVNTFSVYAKANTLNWIYVRFEISGLTGVYFDLNPSTTGSRIGQVDSNIISYDIQEIGNDWFRCSVSVNDSVNSVLLYGSDVSGGAFNSNLGSIYIQDSQLEIGLAATEVISTGATTGKAGLLEDEPRFDYSGGATCPSLLLEPSRTNLIKYSEYRSGGTNASVVNNSTLSPEGVSNGCLFIENTSLNSHGIQFSSIIPINANAVNYTISVFAKAKEREGIQLSFFGDSITHNSNYFNIVNGTTDGDPSTHKIENYGNGWYRCSYTASVSNSTGGYNLVRFIMYNGSSSYYTGDGTSGLYMWGLQVEEGSYPTSYIPNHSGGTITRNRESCKNTDASSIIGQTEGTLLFEGSCASSIGSLEFINIHRSTLGAIFINAYYGKVRFYAWYGNGITIDFISTIDATSTFKAAFAYKDGDSALYCNGQQISLKTEAFAPSATLSSIWIAEGDYSATKQAVNTKQALVFKTRLTNTELATLTTI